MKRSSPQAGFTLIEVIVSLIVAAILGTLLVTMMSAIFMKSGRQLAAVGEIHQLTQAMDNLTAAYNSRIHLAASNQGGEDALDYISSLVDGNTFSQFDVTKLWYSGPPFDGPGSSQRGSGDNFLKITIASQAGGTSLTSIFWSGTQS